MLSGSNIEFQKICQGNFTVINILYGDPKRTYCKYIATNYGMYVIHYLHNLLIYYILPNFFHHTLHYYTDQLNIQSPGNTASMGGSRIF